MNKAFNKYKKAKWIDIRLSKKYRAKKSIERFFMYAQASAATCVSAAKIRAIQSTNVDKYQKAFSIAECVIDANIRISRIFAGNQL